TEALKWYRKAADQGFARAQYFVATMYQNGRGVPVDLTTAYMWFKVARVSGEPSAERFVVDLALKMPPEDVETALKKADEWLKQHPAVK
ncbi:MAG: sel1 repeat family protein, partial [Gammaproteobacteria bacterium]